MLAYVRHHPLLSAAYIMAGAIGFFLLAIVIALLPVSIRNSSPTGYVGHAAEYYGHNPHLHPFSGGINKEPDRLFGVTEAEGIAMLLACTDDKWTFLGKEGRQDSECNAYEYTRCDIANESLLASRWVGMGFERVEFTACKQDLCPDFPVSKDDGGSFCRPPLTIETSKQDRP